MKKRMSKVLSILLASALMVSTGGVVQAADVEDAAVQVQAAEGEAAPAEDVAEAAPAEEIQEEVPAVVEEKVEAEEVKKEETKAETPVEEAPEMDVNVLSAGGGELEAIEGIDLLKDLDAQAAVTQAIKVVMSVTGNELPGESDIGLIQYTQDDVKGNNICGYSQRFDAPSKGTLYLQIEAAQGSRTVTYGVFADEAMTKPVDSYRTISGANGTGSNVFKIPNAGAYYIGMYSSISSTSPVSQLVGAAAIFYNGADRTVNNGDVAVGLKDGQTNYFKFKAPKTGYLRVTGESAASSYQVALCNNSKKALSGDTYFSRVPTYGVTKGKTYYIRIAANYNSAGGYKFNVKSAGISEKSGKTRAKAVNVKKGKTVKGTIQAGSSQADWYKFKLTGKKKVTISLTTGSNDALKVIVYKGGKQVGNGSRTIYNNAEGKLYSTTKWSKGTYYIQIKRANSKSSGYYTLKWR